jgi:uncharacterized protein (TIGR00730 family)
MTKKHTITPDTAETPLLHTHEKIAHKNGNHNNLPNFQLAFLDHDFMLRPELRPIRLQLELLKPELLLNEEGIHSTIVVFGSARILSQEMAEKALKKAKSLHHEAPNTESQQALRTASKRLAQSYYYEQARLFAQLVSGTCLKDSLICDYAIITGGGPGIMEAANRGADEIGAKSIGLNIGLPFEQNPNIYSTPKLTFNFQYFAIRKMHFLIRARALVAFPGGFGTLDELFEALTLVQTGTMKAIPIILFGREFWQKCLNLSFLVEEGLINADDLKLFHYVESAEEARDIIMSFYE